MTVRRSRIKAERDPALVASLVGAAAALVTAIATLVMALTQVLR